MDLENTNNNSLANYLKWTKTNPTETPHHQKINLQNNNKNEKTDTFPNKSPNAKNNNNWSNKRSAQLIKKNTPQKDTYNYNE